MAEGRPKKKRTIRKSPQSFRFSPRGRRGKPGNVVLKMEEFGVERGDDDNDMQHYI